MREGGESGVQSERNGFRPRPSSIHKCEETHFLKIFIRFLGKCDHVLEKWVSEPPHLSLGMPLFETHAFMLCRD